MRAHRINTTIPPDHEVVLRLPGDIPAGNAEILVLYENMVPGNTNLVSHGMAAIVDEIWEHRVPLPAEAPSVVDLYMASLLSG